MKYFNPDKNDKYTSCCTTNSGDLLKQKKKSNRFRFIAGIYAKAMDRIIAIFIVVGRKLKVANKEFSKQDLKQDETFVDPSSTQNGKHQREIFYVERKNISTRENLTKNKKIGGKRGRRWSIRICFTYSASIHQDQGDQDSTKAKNIRQQQSLDSCTHSSDKHLTNRVRQNACQSYDSSAVSIDQRGEVAQPKPQCSQFALTVNTTIVSSEIPAVNVVQIKADEVNLQQLPSRPCLKISSAVYSNNNNTSERRCHKGVSFSKRLEGVRYYNRIMGEHPCCRSGPPLSLGWKYYTEHDDMVVSTEEQPQCLNSRSKCEQLNTEERWERLTGASGYYSQRDLHRMLRSHRRKNPTNQFTLADLIEAGDVGKT